MANIPLPGMMQHPVGQVSWGLQDSDHGFDAYSNDPEKLVEEMIYDGFWGVQIQVLDKNLDGAIALQAACKRRNFQLHCGGWTNVAQEGPDLESLHHIFDLMRQAKVGFFDWNIEERWGLGGTRLDDPHLVNECHRILCSEARKNFLKMPMCVQTNGGGFESRNPDGSVAPGMDHAASGYYNKAQIWCNHEDYWVNSPNLTPSAGDFWAHDGWAGTGCQFRRPSISTCGIFGSETGRTNPDGSRLVNTVVSEIPRLQASGRHHFERIWTLEYMTQQDREDFRTKGRSF